MNAREHNNNSVINRGPLKALAGHDASVPSQRFLIVTDIKDSSQVVLRQTNSGTPDHE